MPRYLRRSRGGSGLCLLAAAAAGLLSSCDPMGIGNGPLRFGQSGEIRVTVESPLYLGAGWLRQVLTWRSDGAWRVIEEIGYRGTVGEEHTEPAPGLPFEYASLYASLIQKLNDDEGFKLIGFPALDEIQDPECRSGMSRVTVRMYDESGREGRDWTRCADGSLANLTTRGSGPDVAASRVVQAAIFVRNSTVGTDFISRYSGSLPFATLDRGTETGSGLEGALDFRSPNGAGAEEAPEGFEDWWSSHVGDRQRPLPEVDWANEMIVAVAPGVREEIGDSVEVRRVLAIDNGTRVEWVERTPGNFCAPARRRVEPIHIVVVPKAPEPVLFVKLPTEAVPCGS
ncbi:MAG: hypothetical protein F4087_09275 [Gemmatimonadetes bacterium]|nr:hypothetical protein [Gemmatimonadota bacterium]MYA12565.1 hypothetical protein [Gemmatimonadota bacterium]MYJ68681.1 hypothetical protein [Gemmatimonadota bacterium]